MNPPAAGWTVPPVLRASTKAALRLRYTRAGSIPAAGAGACAAARSMRCCCSRFASASRSWLAFSFCKASSSASFASVGAIANVELASSFRYTSVSSGLSFSTM